MIISIASGKGGTGKTTVATNLALSLGKEVGLLDCDVEEPNAHLFLQPEIEDRQRVAVFVPEVDRQACTLCRKCVDICRFSALAVAGSSLLVFPELCHGCKGCLQVCPEGAIVAAEREIGEVEKGSCGSIRFSAGRMRIGEAMSPPLIKEVRSREKECDITIIDAPPGTSCPVIVAMKDTDFVLLVTEPTPFGLHDLKLAAEAVKILGIPCGLVINRANLGDEGVSNYAAEEGIPILMEIPFDRQIAEAYSKGVAFVELFPEWADRFRGLYAEIEKYAVAEKES
ncbi:MAG: (4Fe-4S)-binding protein [Deltaproteobacteria bacterium]|nr:MAG: (4Fe-4S)-binding protein [Deltaproteobacteria bacterium]